VELQEGVVTVSSTVLDSKKTTQKKIPIRPFVTPTATVGVKFGATIPTADYANVKVDVFVSVPCYVEEIVDVFNQVRSLANELMTQEVERITEDK